jgi:ATP-dependent RNA helicase DDX52/ROK1
VTIDYDENKAIDPIASFQDLLSLGVDSWLVEAIEQQGWTTPTPIQAHLLPVWLNSEQRMPDILARAPTGSGKTAAYVVPVLHHLHRLLSAESAPKQTKTNKNAATKTTSAANKNAANKNAATKSAVNNSLPRTEQTASSVRALILAPTRELTQQISHLATQLLQHAPREISVHVLGKSISPEQRPELLISTPQRLLTLIEKRKLDISRVQYLVLDEADQLLKDDFMRQIDTLLSHIAVNTRHIALFSATVSPGIQQLADTVLVQPFKIRIGADKLGAVETINQRLLFVGTEEGKLMTLRQMIRDGIQPPVLIFVNGKQRAQSVFRELIYDSVMSDTSNVNLKVDLINGDRTQAQRDRVVQQFREGHVWLLVTTDLLARGMDFFSEQNESDPFFRSLKVINFDVPNDATTYIHRVGRSGRNGQIGEAITFYTLKDLPTLHKIINVINHTDNGSKLEVPDWLVHSAQYLKKNKNYKFKMFNNRHGGSKKGNK